MKVFVVCEDVSVDGVYSSRKLAEKSIEDREAYYLNVVAFRVDELFAADNQEDTEDEGDT